jgi:hypothetical protein
MVMLGLGDSVATPSGGIQAQVMVVHNFEQLEEHAAQARGRIVLFNVPFTNYGETVRFRAQGPSRAAKYGAVAVLVRASVPPVYGHPTPVRCNTRRTPRRFRRRRSPPKMQTGFSGLPNAARRSWCG